MHLRILMASLSVLVLCSSASAANYTIDNPADRINNPASRLHNPATKIENPAEKIYNPAADINKPDPVSPAPSPSQPQSGAGPNRTAIPADRPDTEAQARPVVPYKNYHFKRVRDYVNAAKKAFSADDYLEFLSITEDALRRISAGTLKASMKTRKRLEKFKIFGYGLIEPDKEKQPQQ